MSFSFCPGAPVDLHAPWIQEAAAREQRPQGADETPVTGTAAASWRGRRRARVAGRFRADNPETPQDEAWEDGGQAAEEAPAVDAAAESDEAGEVTGQRES